MAKEPTNELYLSRLRIKNFRSIADLDVPINRLTVLVGPNGSGKSNIVDALRFLRDALTRGLDQALLNRKGFQAIQRWNGVEKRGDVSLGVTYSSPDGDHTVSYDVVLAGRIKQGAIVKGEELKTSGFGIPSFRIVREGENYNLYRDDDLLPSNGSKTPYDIISTAGIAGPFGLVGIVHHRYYEVFDRQLPKIGQRLPMANYESAGYRLYGGIINTLFYELHPSQFREPQKLVREAPLDEKGQNLAAVLRQLQKNKQASSEIKLILSRLIEEVDDFSVKPTGSYLVTYLHYKHAGKLRKSDLEQESDGTLRILGILASLYQDTGSERNFPFGTSENGQLIAIEEPEAHIHPGMLAVLADIFVTTSQQKQILLTTHSPDLLDYLPIDSFLVVEKVDGATQAGPLDPVQVEVARQQLFTPGELLRSQGLHRAPDSSAAIS